MNRFTPCAIILSTFSFSVAFAAETVQLNGHAFQLPEGFAIEQIAGPPLVDRPSNRSHAGKE